MSIKRIMLILLFAGMMIIIQENNIVHGWQFNVTSDLSATDTGNWISTSQIRSVSYDSTRNVVYLGGGGGVFGVYNASTNVTSALRATDPGNWISSNNINSVLYDSTSDVVYLGGQVSGGSGGVFGVYNASTNVTSDLSATDPGNWLNIIYSFSYDSTRNVVYLGVQNGRFGVYNASTNVTSALNATDPENWIASNAIWSLTYDSTRDVIYLGGSGGVF